MGVYEWDSVIKQGNINIIPLTIISAVTKITVLMSTSLQVDVFLNCQNICNKVYIKLTYLNNKKQSSH